MKLLSIALFFISVVAVFALVSSDLAVWKDSQLHSSIVNPGTFTGDERAAIRSSEENGSVQLAAESPGDQIELPWPAEWGALEEVERTLESWLDTPEALFGMEGAKEDSEFGFQAEARRAALVRSAAETKSRSRASNQKGSTIYHRRTRPTASQHSASHDQTSKDQNSEKSEPPKSSETSVMDVIHGPKGELF